MRAFSPGELLTIATSLAVAVSAEFNDEEIETVINFVNILNHELTTILDQRIINRKSGEILPVLPILDED